MTNRPSSANGRPDPAALEAATVGVMKAYALFRSPRFGGSELVQSEYRDIVEKAVTEYLRASPSERGAS